MSFVSRHRFPLVVGLVLLGVAVTALVGALRRDPPIGPPLMIMPAFGATSPAPTSVSPWPAESSSPSPSISKSPVASRRPPSSPRSASPAPRAVFTARLSVSAGRFGPVRGVAVVTNEGAAARGWSMVVTIPGVRMTRAEGGSASGSTVTFTGSSLGPDKSVTVTFRGFITSRDVGPVSCSIEKRACEITTRGIPE
jgi:hypothetical protein